MNSSKSDHRVGPCEAAMQVQLQKIARVFAYRSFGARSSMSPDMNSVKHGMISEPCMYTGLSQILQPSNHNTHSLLAQHAWHRTHFTHGTTYMAQCVAAASAAGAAAKRQAGQAIPAELRRRCFWL